MFETGVVVLKGMFLPCPYPHQILFKSTLLEQEQAMISRIEHSSGPPCQLVEVLEVIIGQQVSLYSMVSIKGQEL